MQLLNILGLACVNEDLRNRLFEHGSAGLSGFALPYLLSEAERGALNNMTARVDVRTALAAVGTLLLANDCAEPPCPWDFKACDWIVRPRT